MKRSHKKAGMSLLEAVVWVFIFISAMIAIMATVLHFYRTSSYVIQQASALSSAQKGIDFMVRTIREASYASSGAYPIVSLAPSDLVFYADIDSDPNVERVHYYLQNNVLMKGVLDPTGDPPVYSGTETVETVSENLRNSTLGTAIFAYYDESGTQITDYARIGEVRFISATVLVDVDPSRTPVPISLRSSAALRNLVSH